MTIRAIRTEERAGVMSTRRWRPTGLFPYALVVPGVAWLVVFFVLPLLTLVQTSLQTGSLERGYQLTWRFANYPDALVQFAPHLGRAFGYAITATMAALLLAYPLAYFMAFHAGRWRNLLLVLVVVPLLVSFLVRTLAWKIILADEGAFVHALQAIGLLPPTGRLLASGWAVIAGLTYNLLPFMILPIYVSLERIDRRLVEAAGDLYASPATVFRRVTLPLSRPGVAAGVLLTFIPATGDYVNARFLGTPAQAMIGNVINYRFLVVLDYPTAAALSCVLLLVILVLTTAWLRRGNIRDVI